MKVPFDANGDVFRDYGSRKICKHLKGEKIGQKFAKFILQLVFFLQEKSRREVGKKNEKDPFEYSLIAISKMLSRGFGSKVALRCMAIDLLAS